MREDAQYIIENTIADVMPDKAVSESLAKLDLIGHVYVAAIGKAAWVMADEARRVLGDRFLKGIIITKYGHSRGPVSNFEIIESGHPTPDKNSVLGAEKLIQLFEQVTAEDTVLLLLSGGGSSLAELPVAGVDLEDIQDVTRQLLRSGAAITEINVLRKKLSAIKGGKLTVYLKPAKAYSIILSDILGENEDMIASGLTYADTSTREDVREIIDKYDLKISNRIYHILMKSSPCEQVRIENHVVGSVSELCYAAARHAAKRGYETHILTSSMECEASEAGRYIVSMAQKEHHRPFALIAGGETVVKVKGSGMGGRNQEIALSAALALDGIDNMLVFSLGSDGTDGPTDAAGGIVDGRTASLLREKGTDPLYMLENNDSYHALKQVNGLIITGATGTNVNDVTVLLCR